MDNSTISKRLPGVAEQSTRAIIRPFSRTLSDNGLELRKRRVDILQINIGLMCNQTCLHCHLEAGPHRIEIMSKKTMIDIEQFAGRSQFQVADITGGSPYMNPHLVILDRCIFQAGSKDHSQIKSDFISSKKPSRPDDIVQNP